VTQVSYSDLYAISHLRGYEEEIAVGDLVRTGPNRFPHYQVVAVNGDKAWLKNVQTDQDCLAELARCRKINGPFGAND